MARLPPTSGWRLLGVHRREVGLFAVRVVSGRRALAGRCGGGDRRRSDRLAALDERAAAASGARSCFLSSIRSWRSSCCAGRSTLGLPIVDTLLWGGIFVSLLTAVVGIVFSLPLGVLLALGRRSRLPVVRLASVLFIEFVRGVPFITILFMANNMLPLFVPEAWTPDRLLRPLVGSSSFRRPIWRKKCAAAFSHWTKDNTKARWRLG